MNNIIFRSIFLFAIFSLLGTSCFSRTEKFSFQLPEKNTDWQLIDPAISYRQFSISSGEKDIELIVYKFDSADFKAQIYHEQPKRFTQWSTEIAPTILINGGYFDENNQPTGWLVIDGDVIGKNQYSSDLSGMVIIDNGKIDLRDSPHPNSIQLSESVSVLQSFPVLIHKGGLPGITEDSEKIARRTVLAKTKEQQLLVIIVDQTPVSLYQLMHGLLASDLDIDIALNLDGGPSTGLIADINNHKQSIIPLTPLPQVVSFSVLPQEK